MTVEADGNLRVLESAGPRQTAALGAEIASLLAPGDVVLVRGELGAGKTTFVSGAAGALGVTDPVTSPTFAIGHRYRGAGVEVSHLDLYRLRTLADEDPGLLDDYLDGERVAFVEWPEVAAPQLDRVRFEVTIEHRGGDRRSIEVRRR